VTMWRRVARSLVSPRTERAPAPSPDALAELASQVDAASRATLGRSLSIRQVDAGSCNGCELEIHALANPLYDLERFGLKFVASPRHADVLLVTGPVTTRMREPLLRAYAAMPEPRIVAALGDCAMGCGVLGDARELAPPLEELLPVTIRIPGCPPTPATIAEHLVRELGSRS